MFKFYNAANLQRLGYKFYKWRIPLLPQVITMLNYFCFNSYIPSSAKIGEKSYYAYGGIGVVIHSRCIIGDNCIIGTNVTIGGKTGSVNPPTILDNVYIATGSKILGDIIVSKNTIVGANSVLLKSTEPNSVYVGVPAKRIK